MRRLRHAANQRFPHLFMTGCAMSRIKVLTALSFGLAVPAAVRAQSPTVTVGGVSFAQYVYQLKDTANHLNFFDVTRAYINVLGRFDALATRVTPDIYRVA